MTAMMRDRRADEDFDSTGVIAADTDAVAAVVVDIVDLRLKLRTD